MMSTRLKRLPDWANISKGCIWEIQEYLTESTLVKFLQNFNQGGAKIQRDFYFLFKETDAVYTSPRLQTIVAEEEHLGHVAALHIV